MKFYENKNVVFFSRIEFDSGLCNAINEDIQDENDNIEVKLKMVTLYYYYYVLILKNVY